MIQPNYADLVIILVLSLFGTHARVLFDNGTLKNTHLVVEYIIGGFAGLATYFLVKSTTLITGTMELFAIALAGFCARDVLQILTNLFLGKIKSFVTPTPTKEEEKTEQKTPTKSTKSKKE